MVEVRVSSLRFDGTTETCVLFLQEKHGTRALAIWIGRREAESIVIHVQNVAHPRPLTHDLVSSVIHGVGAELRRLHISRIENRTYYAELQLLVNGAPVNIDTRPSDGIAVALRLGAPIHVAEALLIDGELLEAEFSSGDSERSGEETEASSAPDNPPSESAWTSKDSFTAEQLKHYLETLRPEDFGKFNP